MPRALVLGNGSFLVCLDTHGFVRDMYFPYVGLENHVAGQKHRIGVKIDGQFSWIDDGSWQISIGYKPETMVGYLVCKSDKLQLSLVMEDIVYNETNVFLRQVDVYNHTDHERQVQLFFHQVFWISESKKRNTAFYDPTHNALVHYKGRRVFVVNGVTAEGQGMDSYSIGAYQDEGMEGTFRDAEDGELGKNAVEHGSVDSVIRFTLNVQPSIKSTLFYWISVGKSLNEAFDANTMVETKRPEAMIHSTEQFWHAWISKREYGTERLPSLQKKLFDTSLFILRAHVDNRGSIIASADSAMIEWGKDDYAYMWPRDAAYIASVLDKAGFTEVTKPFYLFCKDVLHPDGYLHHRYRSDQSLGSTWHSTVRQTEWLRDKMLQLPIQEDETAGVLVSLWKHYEASKDLEFIESLYKPMIEKMANFLVMFRNKDTGLPMPSYDLWEERIGVSTYTCAAVYGGLQAAANFSELLGKRNHMRDYKQAAQEIKDAMMSHLYSQKLQSFMRDVEIDGSEVIPNEIVDSSSLFGLWYFQVLEPDHPMMKSTIQQVQQRLTNSTPLGGFIRYEHDNYFKSTDKSNPWFITTLWEAQRRLQSHSPSAEDFEYVRHTLDWVEHLMYQSGVLAEQLNPYTRESLSATPLAWSHAVYVETILMYIDKISELENVPPPVVI